MQSGPGLTATASHVRQFNFSNWTSRTLVNYRLKRNPLQDLDVHTSWPVGLLEAETRTAIALMKRGWNGNPFHIPILIDLHTAVQPFCQEPMLDC